MPEMPPILLVDINVLGIGSMRQYRYRDMRHGGNETGAIHGSVDKMAELISAYPDHAPIVLWDDRCRWREELLPRYKRHRWESAEQLAFLQSYLRQAAAVRKLLEHLGLPQVSCPGFEADDVVGLICRRADPTWRIRLATTDADWLQALRPGVEWMSVNSWSVVTHEDLQKPEVVAGGPFRSVDHFVQAKALAGDSSDGIPGVAGVGLKTAAKIIKEHGSVEALWAKHDAGEPIKGVVAQRAAGPEFRADYLRNLRLIDWRMAPEPGFDVEVFGGNRDDVQLAQVCDDWGLQYAVVERLRVTPEILNLAVEGARACLLARRVAGLPQGR